MATSPSHRWGQIIGQEFLEVAIEPLMRDVAAEHGLYLDQKGPRAARKGNKISRVDLYGNTHDLDFVLERNGSDARIGSPVAFIETACADTPSIPATRRRKYKERSFLLL